MKPDLKNILFIIPIIIFFNQTLFAQDKSKINFNNCTINNFPLYGKIKFVDSFPDITIKIVESFPDLKVKIVNSFPDECGEWKIVDSFPDIKVKIVDFFPEIKVKFDESFPGKP